MKKFWIVLSLIIIIASLNACTTRTPSKTTPSGERPADLEYGTPYPSTGVTRESLSTLYDFEGQMERRAQAAEMVRVGMLVPLTGKTAKIGGSLKNAAQLAMLNIPSNIILTFYDTRGTDAGAEEAAAMARADDAALILGPLFADEVKAARSVTQGSGIPMISFTSDSTAVDSGVYSLGFFVRPQVERILTYAKERGKDRIAILAPDNSSGQYIVTVAREIGSELGISINPVELYQPANPNDISRAVKKIADYDRRHQQLLYAIKRASGESKKALEKRDTLGQVNYDALLLVGSGSTLRTAASMLPLYDVSSPQVQLLGTSLWDDPQIYKEQALSGGWFTAPARMGKSRFNSAYQRNFGEAPMDIASLAYDAVALASLVTARGNVDEGQLLNPSGFSGIDGTFRLLPQGPAERGLAIYEVTSQGSITAIAPPPSRF